MTNLREAAEYLLEGVEAAIKAGDWKVDGACDPDSAIVRLRQALAQPDEVLAEREACARLVEADGLARGDEGLVFIKAAGRIRARSEKPPVKTYCGGKPNYCTPEVTPEVTGDVDAVNMSQERVDETEKRKHNPWPSVQCTCGGTIYFKHTKREWVGITDLEIKSIAESCNLWGSDLYYDVIELALSVEKKVKQKNFTET